jgi:hypothetical protein
MADPDYIFNGVGTQNTIVSKQTVGTIFKKGLEGQEVIPFNPPSRKIMFEGKD